MLKNRRQYDADGRNLQSSYPDDPASSAYDAAGRMVRSSTARSDAVRWYAGDGREAKRLTFNLVETDTESYHVRESTKYYIRSSVLGGQVISEAWSNGKKHKTFVRAAGALVAWQSAYSGEAAQLQEAVFFEHADASGMSRRTSDRNGVVIAAEGGEGAPVETDPMGGNVGLFTPYIELTPPYEPPQEFPMLQPAFETDMMFVDGRFVPCMLDGFAIGCSQARDMLQNGIAIPSALAPFQNLPGFQFNGNGLGIFTVRVPVQVGWHVNLNGSVSREYSTHSFNTYVFSISWGVSISVAQQDTGTLPKGKKGGDFVNRFFDRKPNCLQYFQNILGNKFNDFLASLREMDFVDARFDEELLNKTAAELKIPTIADDGTFGPLGGTLRDISKGATAVASPDTNTAYLFNDFFGLDSDAQDLVKIHENLHSYLRRNHVGILRALQQPVPDEFRSTLPRINLVINQDQMSAKDLDKWLKNDCK